MNKLHEYFNLIEKIDYFIQKGETGSPKELAEKLSICERSVYSYIGFMKSELHAPIVYDFQLKSYSYQKNGKLELGWENIKKSLKKSNGQKPVLCEEYTLN
ncbi:MAG: hypothetical protein Q8907_03305 [Bacteroidota bacterium]|nr:hypothetical protein [Bacteroidota bacterium]MDP4225858.1 hypothetical protein [Bacteroidota bacterium]MDP4273289.1 hypothetical protein [Bacteroidota bacterium]